jgi:hypothetical protein
VFAGLRTLEPTDSGLTPDDHLHPHGEWWKTVRMDYAEAREAFFPPRARDAYVAVGLDLLTGYERSRSCVLGEPDPGVADVEALIVNRSPSL